MAGLGRVQQKFNAAVMAVMALLATQRKDSARQSVIHMGQPLARKYARCQNYEKATGRNLRRYPGYCSGLDYRKRKGATLLPVGTGVAG